MKARYLALAMIFGASAVTDAKAPISMRVSPAYAFAPANLVIQTSVEPNPANRYIEVIADSGSFYRSSMMPLEGARAARTTMFQFRSVPPGEYAVSATVFGPDGRARGISRAHVGVLDSGTPR
jgi:hypothetical protein